MPDYRLSSGMTSEDRREFERVILDLAKHDYITLSPDQTVITGLTSKGMRAHAIFLHLIDVIRRDAIARKNYIKGTSNLPAKLILPVPENGRVTRDW